METQDGNSEILRVKWCHVDIKNVNFRIREV
jgi:hypothetical protein